ncbi:MAG TPA: sodium ion-translocating decarboxylase subunit beta [Deltaproteobacteria bacterium]|nr:sodium ion-translocating decarboxylase subunit beta [Deltaproteobacteria bacterium]HPJ92829.1 sodium ion-translocating decarboxylase subunit beta [Deltaproteobacteria bacterium]HPR50347.1 sodium ion-translocating decarboxylase subunit beta [Deltaproteobacteria bacterium]
MKKLFLAFMLFLSWLPAASGSELVSITAPADAKVIKVQASGSDFIYSGDTIATLKKPDGNIIHLRAGVSGKIMNLAISPYDRVKAGQIIGSILPSGIVAETIQVDGDGTLPPIRILAKNLYESTGLAAFIHGQHLDWTMGSGRVIMILIGFVLLYLGIHKGFEPLLLVPIGFGAVLANIPVAGIAEPGGLLYYFYEVGITTGVFPLLIFMGVGAMTDFGPMIANPKTSLLGAAAQFGIFVTLIGALMLNCIPGIDFTLKDAAAIGIIGGADGPTAIFLSSRLSPRLLGSIAVAAYSYMALVPIIQPPIMRALTTKAERQIVMRQMRYVSKLEKILFPLVVLCLCILLLPSASPLIGALMFGNLVRECGVTERLSTTLQNALINIVTIFLGLGVGSKLSADKFLSIETLGILLLGAIAFSIGTASGVIMGKIMAKLSKTPINPLIGAAGVSAVPMAARVVNKVGLEYNAQNYLLMHAMGPNVSGVIGSAVAAGVLLAIL